MNIAYAFRLISSAAALTVAVLPGAARAGLVDTPARAARWEIEEVTLASGHSYLNPVRDVAISAEFRSPSGKIVNAAGFFDGGQMWKVRLMPDEEGRWTFRTKSNDRELSGKTGSFTVDPARAGHHGPVRVADKYHFSYADNTPFYMLGTTQYSNLIGGQTGRIRMLSRVQHSGFNKVRFMVMGGPAGGDADGVPQFERDAQGRPDFSRPNPDYFKAIEAGLRDLRELNVEADLILFVPYQERLGTHNASDMGPAADQAYLRYVVARLASFSNVWWTITNEFDLYKVPKDWKQLGELVASVDPYHHLRSIHHSVLGYYDNSEPWITHVNIQDVTIQQRSPGARNLGAVELEARSIGKPVVVDEYGYEGNNGLTWGSLNGPEIVGQHWAMAMAGAYATYGESYYRSANELQFVGDAVPRLAFLKQIMSQEDFHKLEPANDVVTASSPLYVPTAIAERGKVYFIYVPEPRNIASWNLGFYGPASVSHPLPLKAPYGDAHWGDKDIRMKVDPGIYKVDLIDPWQMRVIPIGYTLDIEQTFAPRIAPGVIRLTRVDAVPAGAAVGSLTQLMNPKP